MQVTLEHTQETARNIVTFCFSAASPFSYIAGQFTELYLPHQNADDRGEKHWFTLSSSPTEELLQITTKRPTGIMSTFKQELFGLNSGSKVVMSEPMGDFILPKDPTVPLVFVAGGIGITPVRSIVKYLDDTGEKRDIRLIYAVRTKDEVAFDDIFYSYDMKVEIILSSCKNGNMDSGHITGEDILKLVMLRDQMFFVSGPEPMVEKLESELLFRGVPKQNLVLDFYHGYKEA